jgi:hypothetical protein
MICRKIGVSNCFFDLSYHFVLQIIPATIFRPNSCKINNERYSGDACWYVNGCPVEMELNLLEHKVASGEMKADFTSAKWMITTTSTRK